MISLVMMKMAENAQNTALAKRKQPIYTITLASYIGRGKASIVKMVREKVAYFQENISHIM